jgi:hypothetical protein
VAGKKASSTQKALTIRVPAQWMDVLDAARFLRGHDSMQNLIEDVLSEYRLKVEQDPAVKKALEARGEYQSKRSVRLVHDKPDRPLGSVG